MVSTMDCDELMPNSSVVLDVLNFVLTFAGVALVLVVVVLAWGGVPIGV